MADRVGLLRPIRKAPSELGFSVIWIKRALQQRIRRAPTTAKVVVRPSRIAPLLGHRFGPVEPETGLRRPQRVGLTWSGDAIQ